MAQVELANTINVWKTLNRHNTGTILIKIVIIVIKDLLHKRKKEQKRVETSRSRNEKKFPKRSSLMKLRKIGYYGV